MQADMHRGPKDGSGIGGFAWALFAEKGIKILKERGRVKIRGKERNNGDGATYR
jgi:hypothetical protein